MKQTDLRSLIADSFNKSELRSLCFDLDINFENLSGETLDDKSRELITYCKRQGRLEDLISRCRELRPQKNWHAFKNSDLELDTKLPDTPWRQGNSDVSVDKVNKLSWDSILLTIFIIFIIIVGWFLILRSFMSINTLKYGDPIKLTGNSYVVKLAGNEMVKLFEDALEVSFVERPDGTVVIARGSLVPDIGRLDVRSLGYPRQTFNLGLNETASYESDSKFSILITDIYFPDSDWGSSDAYIEFVVTKE